jgi:hypothetical protein
MISLAEILHLPNIPLQTGSNHTVMAKFTVKIQDISLLTGTVSQQTGKRTASKISIP